MNTWEREGRQKREKKERNMSLVKWLYFFLHHLQKAWDDEDDDGREVERLNRQQLGESLLVYVVSLYLNGCSNMFSSDFYCWVIYLVIGLILSQSRNSGELLFSSLVSRSNRPKICVFLEKRDVRETEWETTKPVADECEIWDKMLIFTFDDHCYAWRLNGLCHSHGDLLC